MERINVSDNLVQSSSSTRGSGKVATEARTAAEVPVPSIYTDAVAELVAIGAAIATNCDPCFKYHFQQARKLGISREDMMLAVETAKSVKETPAKAMLQMAQRYLEGDPVGLPTVQSCCG